MPAILFLAILCSLITGVVVGGWRNRSWGRQLLAVLLIAIANSVLWNVIQSFVLYPESLYGTDQNWLWVMLPGLALWCIIPAAVGVFGGAAFRHFSTKTSKIEPPKNDSPL